MKSRRITFKTIDGIEVSFYLNALTLAEINEEKEYSTLRIMSTIPHRQDLSFCVTFICFKDNADKCFSNPEISREQFDKLCDILEYHVLEVVTLDDAHKNMSTTEQLEMRGLVGHRIFHGNQ